MTNLGSIAEQYAQCHIVNDFSAFIISLYATETFNEQSIQKFINYEKILPPPTLGVYRIDIFLKTMKILKKIWTHFSEHFYFDL